MENSPQLLTSAQLDALGLAILSLSRELWVLKDRQIIMEAMLEARGLVLDLDGYQPGPELAAKLARERDAFLSSLSQTLLANQKNP
jgi:hypothetical protein